MSTGRVAHHDEGFGDSLGERIEVIGEIVRPHEEGSGRESTDDLPHDLPEVGTAAFQSLNRRRVELIEKAIAAPLTGAERDELERLENICRTVLNRAFPLLPIDLDALVRHCDNPPAGKEGRGA